MKSSRPLQGLATAVWPCSAGARTAFACASSRSRNDEPGPTPGPPPLGLLPPGLPMGPPPGLALLLLSGSTAVRASSEGLCVLSSVLGDEHGRRWDPIRERDKGVCEMLILRSRHDKSLTH
jgi:hypothetical protein